jgi:hypothetical protein
MDMKTVRKALPNDLFEEILQRFKRKQANKIDVMNQYMVTYLMKNDPLYRDIENHEWYDNIETNEELDTPWLQADLKIEQRKNERQVLEDMRYTFYNEDDMIEELKENLNRLPNTGSIEGPYGGLDFEPQFNSEDEDEEDEEYDEDF